MTPPTALAALEPKPLPKGIFLWISISMPHSFSPRCSSNLWAEKLAVFFSGSIDNLPPSPVIREMRIPGLSEKRATISSPGLSSAKPRMSKPTATLATEAGAKTLTEFMFCLGI